MPWPVPPKSITLGLTFEVIPTWPRLREPTRGSRPAGDDGQTPDHEPGVAMPRRLMALTVAISLGCAACGGDPVSHPATVAPTAPSTARTSDAAATGAD